MCDSKRVIKISGYLEKKGKMRMVWTWKKYWFVLEGRLLLYYRSRDEYEAISPCKGSINFGPPCTVKPCPSINCGFQIQTRSNTFTLRAENRVEQERWMEAILSALNQRPSSPTKLSHFRYSLDDLAAKTAHENLIRQNTMPERGKIVPKKREEELVRRLQEIGAQTYGGSLNSIVKTANHLSPKLPKSRTLAKTLPEDSIQSLYATIDELKDKTTSIDSVLVENDHYAKTDLKKYSESVDNIVFRTGNEENIYERISDDSNHPKSFLVENDYYKSIDRTKKTKKSASAENIYAVPKFDHNKNSLIVDNDQYVPIEDEKYSLYCTVEEAPKEETASKEGLYEDPDCFRTDETSSQSSSGESKPKKTSRLKTFADKLKKCEKNKDSNGNSVKKSYSFMQKMLRKKSKKTLDQNELNKNANSVSSTLPVEEDVNLQMLSELHRILVNKKNLLEKIAQKVPKEENEVTVVELYKPPDFLQEQDVHPGLPPRQKNKQHNDAPSKGNFFKQFQLGRPNKSETTSKLKTIDEILDDLDKEKQEQESKPKVKQLIRQFSGTPNEEEEQGVVLRRNNNVGTAPEPKKRHSDELYQLLEELCKVTSAPILTPGVTSSLVTPNLTDEEWLDLLPIRKRRFSDPDYDVPRPHRSLQIQPRVENPENVIPATRFFGPVLTATNGEQSTTLTSMTPDSLDVPEQTKTQESYCSHHYVNNDAKAYDFEYYSHPRPYQGEPKGSFADSKREEVKQISPKAQDVFIDSLEPYAEVSTPF